MGIIFLYCSKKWSVAQIQEYTTSLTFRMFLMILKYFEVFLKYFEAFLLQREKFYVLWSILQSLETFWRLRKSCIPEFEPLTTFYYSIKKIPQIYNDS